MVQSANAARYFHWTEGSPRQRHISSNPNLNTCSADVVKCLSDVNPTPKQVDTIWSQRKGTQILYLSQQYCTCLTEKRLSFKSSFAWSSSRFGRIDAS